MNHSQPEQNLNKSAAERYGEQNRAFLEGTLSIETRRNIFLALDAHQNFASTAKFHAFRAFDAASQGNQKEAIEAQQAMTEFLTGAREQLVFLGKLLKGEVVA